MNMINRSRCAGAAIAAILASIGFSPSAKAQFVLAYEEAGNGHAVGDIYTGPFRINLQNFDMGTVYPDLGAVGTARGYGQNGTGPQSVGGGITTLNGIPGAVGATGAQPNEDTWGIARILTITDLAGQVVWSESVKNAQLTVMFHGEQDFYVNQLANGFQEINGAGMNVDLYFQSKTDPGYTAYNPFPGSLGRTGAASYATVTDGTQILTTTSTSSFIHNDGTLGGLATEFSSVFNATSGGTGQVYLSVTGGSEASRFNTNAFTSPFVAGVTADLFAQFTTFINNPAVGDWLVRSNDPVQGIYGPNVPDASASVTYGLMSALVVAGAAVARRRAARQTQLG
jgi:hypothetical protein